MPLIHAVAHPEGDVPDEGFPTLVALHGYGAHGQDLLGLWPFLAAGRMLMLCPQAPIQIQPGYFGFSWYDFQGPGGQTDPTAINEAIGLIDEFLDYALEAYPVRRDRVALLGFSQGGGMAYRLGFANPERWVGLAALSTGFPADLADEPPSDAVGRLPILVQHGAQDATATVEGGRSARDTLRELGLDPDYREYPMGHEVNAASAGDLSSWLEDVLLDGDG
ncbi:MAG: hypothetical protein F4Y98_09595 [Chloroflexi bacterium]|nr:hypothetical protein [Chloroflexota bacterium]